ncbi:MAG: hypothetical protein NZ870_02250, partial [bacterium]|nr:hypothetical protein [bacterium]
SHIINSIIASKRYAFILEVEKEVLSQILKIINEKKHTTYDLAFIVGDFEFINGKKNYIEFKENLFKLSPLLKYKTTLFKFIKNEKISEINQLSIAIKKPTKLYRYFDPVSSDLILKDISILKEKIK